MKIELNPVAFVGNSRQVAIDDDWGNIISEITLEENIPTEAFDGIEAFSHLEIVFFFDQADENNMVYSGRPRGNPDYPVMGIFGQRKKDRPNRIGLCMVELLAHNGRTITVKGLDAINGTPVVDIKPVFREFQTKGTIRQPEWVGDLMKNYW
jgi:tRNA-Thr(GGU) m(6)t(6)A37 methyltransferase TsaA